MNQQGCGRTRRWPILRYFLCVCQEGWLKRIDSLDSCRLRWRARSRKTTHAQSASAHCVNDFNRTISYVNKTSFTESFNIQKKTCGKWRGFEKFRGCGWGGGSRALKTSRNVWICFAESTEGGLLFRQFSGYFFPFTQYLPPFTLLSHFNHLYSGEKIRQKSRIATRRNELNISDCATTKRIMEDRQSADDITFQNFSPIFFLLQNMNCSYVVCHLFWNVCSSDYKLSVLLLLLIVV